MHLKGSLVRDVARVPVGPVREVLLSPDTLTPRWLLVAVADEGAEGGRTVLVPAAAASEVTPGELLVPYARDTIVLASHAEGTPLTEADAARLLEHYGFPVQSDGQR